MRILVDMAVSLQTTEFLRNLGHEVLHVLELGIAGASDEEIIHLAKANGMVILTKDLGFGNMLAATGESEPGVIILRVGDWTREQIERCLQSVLEELPEESVRNAIVIVERQRVRIRRLPIN